MRPESLASCTDTTGSSTLTSFGTYRAMLQIPIAHTTRATSFRGHRGDRRFRGSSIRFSIRSHSFSGRPGAAAETKQVPGRVRQDQCFAGSDLECHGPDGRVLGDGERNRHRRGADDLAGRQRVGILAQEPSPCNRLLLVSQRCNAQLRF